LWLEEKVKNVTTILKIQEIDVIKVEKKCVRFFFIVKVKIGK
jgi:chorismate mutase